ncbi:MAG: bifunctional glutamate N-acetyltransferase/amino-acid acetyltransferase ArgJ [Pseudomonadota bacterium]|nr:MAG: bifunctional glutamate N-acetyltransferase/amino-acid acetyltransferase ArgJ [Pseudomonadota bacterium]
MSSPTDSAVPAIDGVRLAATAAGIKAGGRSDLVLIELAPGTQTAAVFTRNAFCAAPVVVAREHLRHAAPRFLLINSGNANAGLGAPGITAARDCCAAVAKSAGCEPQHVLPFSTGVIGEPLPVQRMTAAIPAISSALRKDGWADAAGAIMTTDTVSKSASRTLVVDGREVIVNGIAKGAGMIRPDMATMLAFVGTDAAVDKALLQQCLNEAVAQSFNCITVDGDTSTNDACVLFATGASGVVIVEGDSAAREAFSTAVREVCEDLAQAIVRDGEGATKFITVEVAGAASENEARAVAFTIAHSPLVKTAFFAGDPNWGRILAAIGRAGVDDLAIDKVTMHLGTVCIVSRGGRDAAYTEEQGQSVMSQQEIPVRVDLGRGRSSATVWTCDLSYDYVKINAEYRT